ncbi:hypothetical protein V1519DRAFT_384773, partial [Lipomyces tetrasporus]
DGITSPLGKAIDKSAPDEIRETERENIDLLESAHIMPVMAYKNSRIQPLLSVFAGTDVKTKLRGRDINSPCNLFCTDNTTHRMFNEFCIGVECLNENGVQYKLCKFVPERLCGRTWRCQDGEDVVFGKGPQGRTIDLPDGELFNIHLAIGRVLHSSRVGEMINKVLIDTLLIYKTDPHSDHGPLK